MGRRTWPRGLGEPGQHERGRIYLFLRCSRRSCLSRDFCLQCPGHPERCTSDQYGIYSSAWLNNDCFVVVVVVFFFSTQVVCRKSSAIISKIYLFLIIYTVGKEKKKVERTFYLGSERM